jgi:hypothetical protein
VLSIRVVRLVDRRRSVTADVDLVSVCKRAELPLGAATVPESCEHLRIDIPWSGSRSSGSTLSGSAIRVTTDERMVRGGFGRPDGLRDEAVPGRSGSGRRLGIVYEWLDREVGHGVALVNDARTEEGAEHTPDAEDGECLVEQDGDREFPLQAFEQPYAPNDANTAPVHPYVAIRLMRSGSRLSGRN